MTKTVDVVVPATTSSAGYRAIKSSMNTTLPTKTTGRSLTSTFVAEGLQRFVAEGGEKP